MNWASRFVLACAALASGCASETARVDLPIPERWTNQVEAGPADSRDLRQWWRGFDDAELDRLIADAMVANRDLAIARARIREALAGTAATQSLLLPRVDANASASRSKDLTRPLPIVDNRSALLVASWEIDLFGGNRLDVKAGQAQARAAGEGLHGAHVTLISEVARNYFELRGLQARTAIVRRNIDVQRETQRLADGRFRAGLATDLDVARATAQLESTQALLPELEAETAARAHRLAVLLGRPPATLDIAPPASPAFTASQPALPALLPSELLEQRPDLRRAREELTVRSAELGSTRTDLFPKFFLSASAGRQSASINPLPYRTADVFSLGSFLTAPIFNAGRIRASIEAADARLAEAGAAYEKTFLEALEDVENAYVFYASSRTRREHLAASFEAAERARRRAEALFGKGAADYLTVLDAQRTALTVEDSLVRSSAGVALATVGLYRAFGGGWEASAPEK